MKKIVKKGHQLIIKDWMARKIKEEKNLSGSFHYSEVYAILKETEKAYQVMISWGTRPVTTWVPKSATEWKETDRDDFITATYDSYEEAKEAFDLDWSAYR